MSRSPSSGFTNLNQSQFNASCAQVVCLALACCFSESTFSLPFKNAVQPIRSGMCTMQRRFASGIVGPGLTLPTMPRPRTAGVVDFKTAIFKGLSPHLNQLSNFKSTGNVTARVRGGTDLYEIPLDKVTNHLEGFRAGDQVVSNIMAHGTDDASLYSVYYAGFDPDHGGQTAKDWLRAKNLNQRDVDLAKEFVTNDRGTIHAMPVASNVEIPVATLTYAKQAAFNRGGDPTLIFFRGHGSWFADGAHPGALYTMNAVQPGEDSIVLTAGKIQSLKDWASEFEKAYPKKAEDIRKKADLAVSSRITGLVDELGQAHRLLDPAGLGCQTQSPQVLCAF